MSIQNEEKNKARKAGLALLALFSLSYISRNTLENEGYAYDFYRDWIANNKLQLEIDEKDIPDIISLAKKGEKWLEDFLYNQDTSKT